ncbi:MAG: helix-turn-helix transcriptional regulator [Clostridiales bacterium]|nr:helix-turn-helix transcriptional regulator [Clostridiales bacterium]
MPKIIENVKQIILDEGKEMLKEKGYMNFSMRDLANKCDIAIGTVYNYFPNKQEIVNALFISSWNETISEIKEVKKMNITFYNKMEEVYKCLERYLMYHIDTFMNIMKDSKSSCKMGNKPTGHLLKEQVLEPCYDIVEEIIENHKCKNEVNFHIESKIMSIFIVNNIINIIRGEGYTFEDFMKILQIEK